MQVNGATTTNIELGALTGETVFTDFVITGGFAGGELRDEGGEHLGIALYEAFEK